MNFLSKTFVAMSLAIAAIALQACQVGGAIIVGNGRPDRHWCGHDRWGRPYCTTYAQTKAPGIAFNTTDIRAGRVSAKYDISHYAAAYVVRAAVLADRGNMTGLNEMGLTKQDAQDLYAGKRLSEEKITAVGEKLNMTNNDTEVLMNKILQVVREK
jgi:hypothetical protein